ncbi:MAG TPA: RNA methyltransferase [Solirubrobacterales bacterium]|nr:RNA methyltransferase [Solirubrobacterales bacterium]
MIESKDNEKLKLVRKLRERRHREREGLFTTEGEDLLEAGLAAGAEPRFVLVAAGSGVGAAKLGDTRLRGPVDEVEPGLLASVSALGSGTRAIAVWPRPEQGIVAAPCVYLDGVGDPGNVGAIVRTAHALLDATVALGPDCADPWGPKATRASMGSLFAHPPVVVAGVEATPEPRVALVAHGGEGLSALDGAGTVCLGSERDGLRPDVVAACDAEVTIPLHGGAESLNVAAAAAVACARMSEAPTDA